MSRPNEARAVKVNLIASVPKDGIPLGNSFLVLDYNRSQTKLIEKKFSKIYKQYNDLINAINNQSREEIYSFLTDTQVTKDNIEKILKSLDDPLMIQVMHSLSLIHYNMQELAQEYLI